MRRLLPVLAIAALSAAAAVAQPLKISIGVRESGTANPIGGNGGTTGGIEWIAKDMQSLPLDGGWHQFTFRFGTDPVAAFAGATANGVLDGTSGALEHIRILSGGYVGPYSIWIDDIVHTDAAGTPTVAADWEQWAANAEAVFQEPSFSGSTSANIAPGSSSLVDGSVAHGGSKSDKVSMSFVDNLTTRWCRLTTFNVANQPNLAIRFAPGDTLTFWMRAIPEPSSLALLALGGLAFARRRA